MSIQAGKHYTHYKGDEYVVATLATDADSLEPLVVYSSKKTGKTWVRKASEWDETVIWPDGTEGPRFRPNP